MPAPQTFTSVTRHPFRSGTSDVHGFLASARSATGCFLDTNSAYRWLLERRRTHRCRIEPVAFAELRRWRFEEGTGNLVHDTGRFFGVHGVRARLDFPAALSFDQPIINQPEVGLLGILAHRFDGMLHFLLQAKMEPGNLERVQFSPTVQATRSNFTRVHGGERPHYLDYFRAGTGHRVLVDQLQSEQGMFFLRKRNRSMIVETNADIPLHDGFQWLTLGQVKRLMQEPHTVNMDTRTVIASIPLVGSEAEAHESGWGRWPGDESFADALVASTLARDGGVHTTDALLSWLTDIRSHAECDVQPCGLNSLCGWERTATELRRADGRYFRIFGVSIECEGREVPSWTQPMVQPMNPGISAFAVKRIGGVLHFLVQARMEVGLWNVIELGPTVMSLPGSPIDEYEPPFMLREVMNGTAGIVRHRSIQSEEGGRFYEYATENVVVELDEDGDTAVPPGYTWVTLGQLNALIKCGHHVNIEARSVLACLDVGTPDRCTC